MHDTKSWLRPRVFLIAVPAWFCLWLGLAAAGGFGVVVDGVRLPMFSARVLGSIARQALPFGVLTPILLHLGARFPMLPRRQQTWWRPASWVLGCSVLHGTFWWFSFWSSTGSWIVLATSPLNWGLPYAGIAAVAVALGHQRVADVRERELLAAQLRALRAQLQPHFLFNTLQAIAVTARRDADATVRMTALLGDLLRQTLCERARDLVTLAEERQMLQPYLELQQLRFADRLTVVVELPADVLQAEVPDLLLQPLVENALQHGIERQPGAGTIAIRARRCGEHLELTVADDGAGPDDADAREGTGLGATRARLRALFGDAAGLRLAPGGVRGTVVTVRLPYREVARAA